MIPTSSLKPPKQVSGKPIKAINKNADLSQLDGTVGNVTSDVPSTSTSQTHYHLGPSASRLATKATNALETGIVGRESTQPSERLAAKSDHTPVNTRDNGNPKHPFPSLGSIETRLAWWCNHSNDVGVPAQTIAMICSNLTWGEVGGHPYTPRGPKNSVEFGQCIRLLERIPEWNSQLWRVSIRYPRTSDIIKGWDVLSDLYYANKNQDLDGAIKFLGGE